MDVFLRISMELLRGFAINLEIFLLTLLFAIPLGFALCFASMSGVKPVSEATRLFIWVIRGTPLMLQIIVVFYVPGLIFGVNWLGRMEATVLAFAVNYACYFSEIYRGGIESVPKGQFEAGQALGLDRRQIFIHVALVQVVKNIIPPMGNEIITLVKDTSLARVIAVYEVMWMGQSFIKSEGLVWPMFYTAAFYLIFSGLLTVVFRKMEEKLDYVSG